MITGPEMSRKDLEWSEIRGSEDIAGRPSSVLFLLQVATFAAQLAGCRSLVAGKKHDDEPKDKHAHSASVASRVAAMRSDLDSRLNDVRPSLRASTRLNT